MAAATDLNPWNVSSLEEFLYYNCPECESKYSNKEQFVGHAMVAHDNAHNILPTILKREKVKASKKDKLIENVVPEDFDDNGNDNCIGIQIAKVESITEDIDDARELITSNNDELAVVTHENVRDIPMTVLRTEKMKAANESMKTVYVDLEI